MIKGIFKHYKIENKMTKISYDVKMEDFKYVRIDFIKRNEDHISTKLLFETNEEKGIVIDTESYNIMLYNQNTGISYYIESLSENEYKIEVHSSKITNNLFNAEVFTIKKENEDCFYINKKLNVNFKINKENKEIYNVLHDEDLDKNELFLNTLNIVNAIDKNLLDDVLEEITIISPENIEKNNAIISMAKDFLNVINDKKESIITNNLKNN